MWQPRWEGTLSENGYIYMSGWILQLLTWNYHNIVTWLNLYTLIQNKMFLKIRMNSVITLCKSYISHGRWYGIFALIWPWFPIKLITKFKYIALILMLLKATPQEKSFQIIIFSKYMPRSGIPESYSNFIFGSLRGTYTIFHSCCTSLHSTSSVCCCMLSVMPDSLQAHGL